MMRRYLKEEDEKKAIETLLASLESGEASNEMTMLHDESLTPEVFTVGELLGALKDVPQDSCIFLKTALGEDEKVLRIEMSASYQIQITTTVASPIDIKKDTGVIKNGK